MQPFSMIFRSTNCAFSLVASLLSPEINANLIIGSRTYDIDDMNAGRGGDIVELLVSVQLILNTSAAGELKAIGGPVLDKYGIHLS